MRNRINIFLIILESTTGHKNQVHKYHLSAALYKYKNKFYCSIMNVSDYAEGDKPKFVSKKGSKNISYYKWIKNT